MCVVRPRSATSKACSAYGFNKRLPSRGVIEQFIRPPLRFAALQMRGDGSRLLYRECFSLEKIRN